MKNKCLFVLLLALDVAMYKHKKVKESFARSTRPIESKVDSELIPGIKGLP